MPALCLRHITLLRPPQPIEDAAILIEDGKITRLGLAEDFDVSADTRTIDCHNLYLAPGYIDLQCNGGFGADFTHDPNSIWNVAKQLPQFGVTSFLPTIITSPLETVEHAQGVLANQPKGYVGTDVLGLHVEGPYINPTKKGAHETRFIRDCNSAETEAWSPETGIRLVTLAPELADADETITQLTRNGVVVSAGHSMATFAEAIRGFDAGISYGTHLFNAMPAIHHREPGLVSALLADERTTIGLIPDGMHVAPSLIKLVWQLAKHRLNIVTDAMAAMGFKAGEYQLGARTVTVDATSARLPDGTLAGSTITLDQAVRNLWRWTGCTRYEAIRSVTEIPADLLNLPHKGRIAVGADADLLLLNSDLEVQLTLVQGNSVFTRLS